MLVVDELVCGYPGGPPVLHEVSLEVAPDEILLVLGRNGAGKTTLLQTISGMLRPRAGTIRLAATGECVGRAPHEMARSGVAHVPEGRRLILSMSVLDNLKLGAYVLGRRAAVEAQLAEIYELFPMLPAWERRIAGTLSGGQQQLLSIARALMARPDVVLLDEPLTGLAPIYRSEVLSIVERLRERRAILLVEQNAAESLPIADRALVLDMGRVTLAGPAHDLLADSSVVKRYLGIPTDSIPAV